MTSYQPPKPTFAQSNIPATNFPTSSFDSEPSYSHPQQFSSPPSQQFDPSPPSFGSYPSPSYQPVLPQQPIFNPRSFDSGTPQHNTSPPINPLSFWSYLGRATSDTSFQYHGTFDDEPPLLEELGINFDYIKRKTISVLNPFQRAIDPELLNDSDLSGPFCFALLLGLILLLSGKWTFDYIYGFGAVGCISMYALVNLMAGAVYNVDVYKTISILGYCLLPMTILAGISVVYSLEGIIGAVLAISCVSWCSYSAALLFTEQHDPDQRLLVFYPLALYYTCFALLTIF